MSRQPPPTASGPEGQGAEAAPYDSGTGEYLNVSDKERGLTVDIGTTTFFCREIERDDLLEGGLSAVLVECNDDYYVLLLRNTYLEPLDVYDWHKRWTRERAVLAVERFVREECVCCDSRVPEACLVLEREYAIQRILELQAKADELQRQQLAKERKKYERWALTSGQAP